MLFFSKERIVKKMEPIQKIPPLIKMPPIIHHSNEKAARK